MTTEPNVGIGPAGQEGLLPQHRYQTTVSTGNLGGYRLAADTMTKFMTEPASDRAVLQTIMETAARMVRLEYRARAT